MKKHLYLFFCIAFIIGTSFTSGAQIITGFAGNGTFGYSGDGGDPMLAMVDSATSIAMDGTGNVYINDQWNNCVRKVSTAGIITTVAGTGGYGYGGDGGPATNATFKANWGVAADNSGNIYITDQSNFRIRKVTASGIITTIAGTGTYGDSGEGGPATDAAIGSPIGIAADPSGNVYFGDADHKCVHKINNAGIISTVAGNRAYGYGGDNGPATDATLSYIWGLAADNIGNLYICDGSNNRIRKVNAGGIITTIAGNGTAGYGGDNGPATAASLYQPTGIFVTPTGNIYIADCYNNRIRKINTSGIITTIGGTGLSGYNGEGIPATNAKMAHPIGVVVDNMENVYVSDMTNGRVRKINNVLAFTGGDFLGLNVCENTTPVSVNSLLAVRDIYIGLTDTWSLLQAPAHGTANAGYTTTSNGSVLTPTGLTYVPVTGYTGNDSFKVKVANSLSSDVITIYISVDPFLSAGVISGPSNVCVGGNIMLTNNTPGGVWSSNGHTSVDPLTLGCTVTGLTAGLDTILYTISNTCGTIFTSKALTINALPDAGTVSGPTGICVATSAALTASVPGGTWSSSNIKADVNPAGTVHAIAPGTATIIYTVTDAFCAATALHNITIEIFPDAGIITGPQKLCIGGTLTQGNAITTGIWSSGNDAVATVSGGLVSGIAAGTGIISYSVSNSCGTAITTKTVTVSPLPDVPVITADQSVLSVPDIYTTYQWWVNGNLIPGATKNEILADITGLYSITITNSFGCSSVSATQEYTECGIDDILIYPNPTSSIEYIQWCKKVTIRLTAADGKEVSINRNVNKIDMGNLPDAVYILNVYDAGGHKIKTKKIIKLPR